MVHEFNHFQLFHIHIAPSRPHCGVRCVRCGGRRVSCRVAGREDYDPDRRGGYAMILSYIYMAFTPNTAGESGTGFSCSCCLAVAVAVAGHADLSPAASHAAAAPPDPAPSPPPQ